MGRKKNWGIDSLLRQIYEVEDIYKEISTSTTPLEDEKFFVNIRLHTELGVCVECESKVEDVGFRTKDERREYYISGLCSKCQEKYFGK